MNATAHDDVDLSYLRWFAANIVTCAAPLSVSGGVISAILAALELLQARLPEDRADDHDDNVQRLFELLQSTWHDMFDVLGMPRRPFPRRALTRH